MANGLYRRLAIGNLRRNSRLYLPYFIATTIMSAIFFIIINTVFSKSISNMRYGGTMMAMLTFGIVIMTLFTFGYMIYINSFLIRSRKKEFGLYGILGLEKRHVGRIILLENLLLNGGALALGLLCGTVFGKLAFLLLLAMVRTAPDTQFVLSPIAYLATAGIFLCIFLVNIVYNQLQVRLANPIDLINGDRKGEKKLRGVVPLTIFGLLATGVAYYFSITVQDKAQAIFLFWPLVVLVIFGTNALFAAGSQFLLGALRKNKRFYYKPKNFISVSGLIYRMKQNAAGLANICILSTMVLVTVSGCLSLYLGQETMLSKTHENDFSMTVRADDGTLSYDAATLAKAAQQLAGKTGATLQRFDCRTEYEGYLALRDGVLIFPCDSAYSGSLNPARILTLADYNAAAGSTLSLDTDEVLLVSNCYLAPVRTLTLGETTFRVRDITAQSSLVDGKNGDNETEVLVVAANDAQAQAFCRAMRGMSDDQSTDGNQMLYIAADFDGNAAARSAFAAQLGDTLYQALPLTEGGFWYNQSSIDVDRASSYMMYGGLLFMGILFTMLFLINTILIMYFKQVSEGYEDRKRFLIMQQVGMSDIEVRSAINRQVLIVFFAPLLGALCHILAASNLMVQMLAVFVMSSVGLTLLCMTGTAVAFAAVYWLVFRATARTYYRIVKW